MKSYTGQLLPLESAPPRYRPYSGELLPLEAANEPTTPTISTLRATPELGLMGRLGGAWDTLTGAHDAVDRPLIARLSDAGGEVVDAFTPDAFQRGMLSGKQATAELLRQSGLGPQNALGQDASLAESAVRVAELERQKGRYPQDPANAAALQAMSGADSIGDWADAVTPGALGDVVLESLGQQAPVLALSAVGGPLSIGANAAGSLGTEYTGAVYDAMREAGVDVADPLAVQRFLADPAAMEAAKASGLARGVPIAAFDALGAGVAGKLVKGTGVGRALLRSATDLATGAGTGTAGEATAQFADTGRIESLGDVLTEGVAEGPSSVVEGVGNVLRAARTRPVPRTPAEQGAQAAEDTLQKARESRAVTEAATPAPVIPAAPVPTEAITAASGTESPAIVDAPASLPRSGTAAGSVIDARLEALGAAAQEGRLAPEAAKSLADEDAELEQLLRAQARATAEGIHLSPEARLSPQERQFAEQRRLEIRQSLERHRAAQGYESEAGRLRERLGRIDADADLIALSESLVPPPRDVEPTAVERRAMTYDRLAASADAVGNATLADQHRHSAAVLRARNNSSPTTITAPEAVGPVGNSVEAMTPPMTSSARDEASTSAETVIRANFTSVMRVPDPETFARDEQRARLAAIAQRRGLDPETVAELERSLPAHTRDAVTGFYRAEERVPFVQRVMAHVAETGERAHYVEADIANLGGLNARLGASGANEVYRELADTVRKTLEATGAQVVPVRNGGDEVSFTVIGAEDAAVDAALARADRRAQAISKARGLSDLPHPKGGAPGVGIVYAASRIGPKDSLDALFRRTDQQVEARKRATADGYRARVAVGAGPDDAGAARGVAPGTLGGTAGIGGGATPRGGGSASTEPPQAGPFSPQPDHARGGQQDESGTQIGRAEVDRAAGVRPDAADEVARHAPPTGGVSVSEASRAIHGLFDDWKRAPTLQLVTSSSEWPASVRARLTPSARPREGAYDPETRTVYLAADAMRNPARARWAALHEVVGHDGLRGAVQAMDRGAGSLSRALRDLRNLPVIEELAHAIARDRGQQVNTTEAMDEATEEAAAELLTAEETDGWRDLEARYRVAVPARMRPGVVGALGRFVDRVKGLLTTVMGSRVAAFSPRDWRDLVKSARRYAREGTTASRPVTTAVPDDVPAQLDALQQHLGGAEANAEHEGPAGIPGEHSLRSSMHQPAAGSEESVLEDSTAADDPRQPDPKSTRVLASAAPKPEAPARKQSADTLVDTVLRLVRAPYESAVDKLRRNPETKAVGDAVARYFDQTRKRLGEVSAALRPVTRAANEDDLRTFERLMGAMSNGRRDEAAALFNDASTAAKDLLKAWSGLASRTGDENQRLGIQVFDATQNAWRLIGKVRTDPARFFVFWPRAVKRKYRDAMANPEKYAREWQELVDILIADGRIASEDEAGRYLNTEFRDETASDYFASIERARSDPLPEAVYDYSWEQAVRYARSWAERVSQIEAFGQAGPEGGDLFDETLATLTRPRLQEHVQRVADVIYGRRRNRTVNTVLQSFSTLATGTQLGNPATAIVNLIGGLTLTAQAFPTSHFLRGLRELGNLSAAVDDAYAKGVLIDDFMGVSADAEQEGVKEWISRTSTGLLKVGGFAPAEYVVRSHNLLTARSFLRDALTAWNRDVTSGKSLKAIAWLQRNGFDYRTLLVEGMTGPETDRFLRYAVNEVQGSYRIDQVPTFMDEPLGRFLLKYQKFSTQVVRMLVKNHLAPFVESIKGGERVRVEVDGEVIEQRVRTFLPLLRYFAMAVPGGLIAEGLRAALFGYGESGPDDEEIKRALADNDRAHALSLILQRAFSAMVSIGSLGVFGNYGQAVHAWQDRQRFKNPLDPPSLGLFDAPGTAILKLIDQGSLDGDDVFRIAEDGLSLFRTGRRLAETVAMHTSDSQFGRQAQAQRDRYWARKIARRYADEAGIEAKRRAPEYGVFTANTPTNRKVKDALLLGDAERAKELLSARLHELDPRTAESIQQTLASVRGAVRAGRPALVMESQSGYETEQFLAWAESRLTAEGFARLKRIDKTYMDAARRSGIWRPQPVDTVKKQVSKRPLSDDMADAYIRRMIHE